MDLRIQLTTDLKEAMRSGDTGRRDTLRLAISAIKNAEIAKRGEELGEAALLAVISKEVKQRRESIVEFRKGGRDDLVEREQAEIEILQPYLPEQLSRDEIRARAEAVIAEVGASGPRDMGKVMPKLTAEMQGNADGREIAGVVGELLAGK